MGKCAVCKVVDHGGKADKINAISQVYLETTGQQFAAHALFGLRESKNQWYWKSCLKVGVGVSCITLNYTELTAASQT